MEGFHASVLTKLRERDSKIQSFYKEVTESYSQLYIRNRKLEDENEQLRRDNKFFKQNNNDPQVLENLRDANAELQKKLTQIYEDYKRVQDNLMAKTEEAQKLSESNAELLKENTMLKEKCSNLEKNVSVKEKNILELADQLKLTQDDRDRLIDLRDKLLSEKTQLINENNQLIQRMMADKQNMIEKCNEINNLHEETQKKAREFEEERRKFEEMKKKFFANVQQKGGNMGDLKDEVDLKVFYTGQKSGSTELTPMKKVKMHENEIYAMAEAYQGDVIATCGGDGFIKFYDPARTTPFLSLKSPQKGQVMTAISFGFDNDLFVSGSADKLVYIWSISTQRLKSTLVGHADRVSSVCFVKDMTRIVSGSHDRSIKIWDVAKGCISKTIMCGSSCNSVKVTGDKTRIISGHYDGSVKVYSTKTGELIRAFKDLHEASITSVVLDFEGNLVLTSSKDNTLKMIDLRMEKALNYSFRHDEYFNPLEYNTVCFANYGQSVAAGSSDGKLFLWDPETGKLQHILNGGNKGGITGTCYSIISGNLYTSDASGNIVVWS